MSAPANTGFWDFSLRVYARDGVAEACLGLQDRRGADVNLLLYCGWAAATGRGALGADELERLVDLTGPWQNSVVQPLRQVRRSLKELGEDEMPAATSLRQDVQKIELAAEKIEQDMLSVAASELDAGKAGDPRQDAEDSLTAYMTVLGVEATANERRDFETLLDAFAG